MQVTWCTGIANPLHAYIPDLMCTHVMFIHMYSMLLHVHILWMHACSEPT